MNPLDIGIVVLCAVLALFGLLKGFVRQAASWTGLVVGLLAGWRYGAAVQKLLRLEFTGGAVASYVLILMAVYVAVRVVGLLIERWVRTTKLSGTDRFLGMLAGGAKGAFLSVLLVFFLTLLAPRESAFLSESKLSPRLLVAARWMERAFPQRIRDAFREKERALESSVAFPQAKNRSRK